MNIVEIAFYIHGVSPDTRGSSHTPDYEAMHQGIAEAAGDASLWPNEFGGAEWGWNFDGGRDRGHKALANAQRIFGGQVSDLVEDQVDPTWNPTRLAIDRMRPLIFNGFGDMFYYASKEGKWAIRYEVGRQLTKHIFKRIGNDESAVSLTLLGHSAGSVVAFDFLYYVFSGKKTSWTGEVKSDWASDREQEAKETNQEMRLLQRLCREGRLRLRRLVTFGSPISFLMMRNNFLIETLAAKKTLSTEQYGLESGFADEEISGPRWINLWDKDDPIAWPVAPIMGSDLVEDVHVDVSDTLSAHTKYWRSRKCHKAIASRW